MQTMHASNTSGRLPTKSADVVNRAAALLMLLAVANQGKSLMAGLTCLYPNPRRGLAKLGKSGPLLLARCVYEVPLLAFFGGGEEGALIGITLGWLLHIKKLYCAQHSLQLNSEFNYSFCRSGSCCCMALSA